MYFFSLDMDLGISINLILPETFEFIGTSYVLAVGTPYLWNNFDIFFNVYI